jgi:hypothetical protein
MMTERKKKSEAMKLDWRMMIGVGLNTFGWRCSHGRKKNCGWNNSSKEFWSLMKNMICCWCCCGTGLSNEKRTWNSFCGCSQ